MSGDSSTTEKLPKASLREDGSPEVIALFGATGRTGRHFLELALNAGYKVQANVRVSSKIDMKLVINEHLTVIEGDFAAHDDNPEQVEYILNATCTGADYVVCLAGGPQDPKLYKPYFMSTMIEQLWPILEELKPKSFVFQANALITKPPNNTLPWHLRLLRGPISKFGGQKLMIDDIQKCVTYMHEHPLSYETAVIVTRPPRLVEPSSSIPNQPPPRMDLMISGSGPGPDIANGISYRDLAYFTLFKVMKDITLVKLYPFIKHVPPPLEDPNEPTTTDAATVATSTTTNEATSETASSSSSSKALVNGVGEESAPDKTSTEKKSKKKSSSSKDGSSKEKSSSKSKDKTKNKEKKSSSSSSISGDEQTKTETAEVAAEN